MKAWLRQRLRRFVETFFDGFSWGFGLIAALLILRHFGGLH